jgi:hypothetical protein
VNPRSKQPASGGVVSAPANVYPSAAVDPQENPIRDGAYRSGHETADSPEIERQKAEFAVAMAEQRKRSEKIVSSLGVIGVGVFIVSLASSGGSEHNCRDGYYSGSKEERLCQEFWREERAGTRLISEGASQLVIDSERSRAAFLKGYGGSGVGARYGGFGGSGSLHLGGGG